MPGSDRKNGTWNWVSLGYRYPPLCFAFLLSHLHSSSQIETCTRIVGCSTKLNRMFVTHWINRIACSLCSKLWHPAVRVIDLDVSDWLKARLHGSPRLINAVELTKVNRVNTSFQRNWSTGLTGEQAGRRPTFVQRRWCTLGYSPSAVDSKMAANELVREGVVICDYLIKECEHILEKKTLTSHEQICIIS
jgi:hypothetical protein